MASVDSLRQAIQFTHQALADHSDPQAKAIIATCLQNLLKVQAQDHQDQGAGGPQGASQGPPQGPPGVPSGPAGGQGIQQLMAALGGGGQ